jgi:hypothetical protein
VPRDKSVPAVFLSILTCSLAHLLICAPSAASILLANIGRPEAWADEFELYARLRREAGVGMRTQKITDLQDSLNVRFNQADT